MDIGYRHIAGEVATLRVPEAIEGYRRCNANDNGYLHYIEDDSESCLNCPHRLRVVKRRKETKKRNAVILPGIRALILCCPFREHP